jgi:hypothetical protein
MDLKRNLNNKCVLVRWHAFFYGTKQNTPGWEAGVFRINTDWESADLFQRIGSSLKLSLRYWSKISGLTRNQNQGRD